MSILDWSLYPDKCPKIDTTRREREITNEWVGY